MIKKLKSCVVAAISLVVGVLSSSAEVALPPGYTPLEWIESTGHQRINTKWKSSATLRCELDFAPLEETSNIMFGQGADYDRSPYRFFNYRNGYMFDVGTGSGYVRVGGDSSKKLAIDGTRYLLKTGIDDTKMAYATVCDPTDGTVIYDPAHKSASTAAPLASDVYVFGGCLKTSWYNEKMRLYGLKMYDIKEGETAHSLVRDFVPCRNEEGVAGLWEKVEGEFYTNCADGEVRFVGPDDKAVRVEWIKSTGSQWINTGVNASGTLEAEMDFISHAHEGNSMIGVCKTDASDWRFVDYRLEVLFDCGSVRVSGTGLILALGTRYFARFGTSDGKVYNRVYVKGSDTPSSDKSVAAAGTVAAEPVGVFGGNVLGAVSYSKMTLYSLKLMESGIVVRDYVPCRAANGLYGLMDLANDNAVNVGTGIFEGGSVFELEGEVRATLAFREGSLTADIAANRTLIAKTSPYEADFSAVTSYPALELRQGTLSVQDDAATAYAIAGTMKVEGGTRLKIDLTAEGCDSFTATTLDFSTLSASAPLFVVVKKAENLTELQQEYVIAEGAGVADGVLSTVVARGDVQAGFEMRQGKLVMIPVSDIPARAVWKGGAAGGLTNAANWTCYDAFGGVFEDGLPTNGTKVVFPDGCAFDWPRGMSFAHDEIVLPASIGGDCDWTGLDAPIDTTIDLKGHKLYVSELKGTGTLTDTTALGENLIQDGGFESSSVSGHSGTWGQFNGTDATNLYWQTTPHWQTTYQIRAGFTKENTPWVANGGMMEGEISGYVQFDGDFYQNVTIPEDGSYVLTYSYASRKGYGSHPLEVRVDDKPCSGKTDSSSSAAVNMVVLHLTKGEHKIAFVGATTSDLATVLDNVSLRKIPTAGELHVVVPEGETNEWTTLKIEGTLKFVKEGKGTYLASNKNGTGIKTWYLGDTWVREGCYKVHPSGSETGHLTEYAFSQVQQLGAQGSETTVEKDATFDYSGNYDGYCYTFVLNGGTFGNLGMINPVKEFGKPSHFRLTDDSLVVSLSDTQLGNTDLGGHTLTISNDSARSCYLCGAAKNGTLVSDGGRFWPYGGDWDMADVDLVLNSKMSCADQTVTFRDLTVTYTGEGFGQGGKFFRVRGTYKPVSDQIHRFKLLDGATIDLSVRTTPLNIQPDANGLSFDENAKTIYVSTAGRKLRSSEPLLTWTTKPDVKFVATTDSNCGVVAKEYGLYPLGMLIIVR